MKRRGGNPKRKVAALGAVSREALEDLARRCQYTGSPLHKCDPGDYNLTPPASPRPAKTLCDAVGRIPKEQAQQLLREAFAKGMIGVRSANEWPEIVWAVSKDGEVFEAQLENRQQGAYHGYPLQAGDDFRAIVLDHWNER